jgi:hypothetical protein
MRILKILLITLFISSPLNASGIGKGPLTLSPATVDHFIKYLKGGYGKQPGSFFVTIDGDGSDSWFCPEGNCQPVNVRSAIKQCEQYWQKECKLFARSRTIKWKNDINPGKGKVSRINSRWNTSEINDKLKELGFLN